MARASDCLSEGRGFEPHQLRHPHEEPMLFKTLNDLVSLDEDWEAEWYIPGHWWLPTKNDPGPWMPPLRGGNQYSLMNLNQVLDSPLERIFLAEMSEDYRRVRLLSEFTNWNERTVRLYACDCVEHSLKDSREYYNYDLIKEALAAIRNNANDWNDWNVYKSIHRDFDHIIARRQYNARKNSLLRAVQNVVSCDPIRGLHWTKVWILDSISWYYHKTQETSWHRHRLYQYLIEDIS